MVAQAVPGSCLDGMHMILFLMGGVYCAVCGVMRMWVEDSRALASEFFDEGVLICFGAATLCVYSSCGFRTQMPKMCKGRTRSNGFEYGKGASIAVTMWHIQSLFRVNLFNSPNILEANAGLINRPFP